MTEEEIKCIIDDFMSRGMMHMTPKHIDLCFNEGDIIDGAMTDGKTDEIVGLAESALKLITEAHPGMSLHTMLFLVKAAKVSELLMENLSPFAIFFDNQVVKECVRVMCNIIDDTAIPDEIQVCIIGGLKAIR